MRGNGFIIDRREEHKDKSPTSRDRFIKRYKDVIKQAAADTVKKAKGFRDLTTGKDGQEHQITIDRKSLDEPQFIHGEGGDYEFVLGGNEEYTVGDTIPKPRAGQGGGGNAGSPDGEGEDAFTFYLNREEFLRLILDDLALPDMVKKNLAYSVVMESVQAGFTKTGSPGNMDVIRSCKMAMTRRIGLTRRDKKAKLHDLEAKLAALTSVPFYSEIEKLTLETEIATLKSKLRSIPYIDPNLDLRFRHREWEKKPSVSAVMFCLMDVSGSMTENMKTHAKYFYMLLHLFLANNYNNVDVVFIRHTTVAEEVDEETFFYDRENGGTIVSSGLEKIVEVIKQRYDPAIWNIYIAQASDGDNYGSDSAKCQHILEHSILPLTQYMVYVEMSDASMSEYTSMGFSRSSKTDLWKCYASIVDQHENLKMKTVGNKAEIYPVFRELFEKQTEKV